MFREKIVPLLWLAAAVIVIGAAAGLSVPRANAALFGAPLRITVSWIGGDCWTRTATWPDSHNGNRLVPASAPGCRDEATATQLVLPGEYFGIDPNIGDAYSVSCTVINAASGALIATDFATYGNGHDVTCLGRWTS